jgi:hypothetical protein
MIDSFAVKHLVADLPTLMLRCSPGKGSKLINHFS